ncbi:MAG: NUDIX domain-containing protein [Flavobacteriales bacterium]|nr:NUDIX domain-containing protein [Flavobacteriales bacterium]
MKECIDIVDEYGSFTGEVLEKEEAHSLGKWHVTAHVWIYNSKGEILFQKRALTKSTFPGLWDISVAGHISAGETVEVGAYREVLEEIGLDIDISDLEKIFVFKESHYHKSMNWYNNEFHHVFLYKFDGSISDLILQKEEVDDVRFLSISDFEKELSDSDKSKSFVSNAEYYKKIIAAVSAKV